MSDGAQWYLAAPGPCLKRGIPSGITALTNYIFEVDSVDGVDAVLSLQLASI